MPKLQMGVLGNQLCVNSNAGRESFARQYQRSEFWYQQEAEASNRAQVLWKNTVVVDDVAVLLATLRVPRTLWWQTTFVVKDVRMMQRIQAQVPGTCWHYGFATATGKVLQATPDHRELVQKCGSPVAALQELLYGDPALPEGAVPHLLGLPEEQRGVLDHLLKEFKGVFPPELPKTVPPDRGLGDVHEIPVKPGTEPISRKMYRHSPKEQLLIK